MAKFSGFKINLIAGFVATLVLSIIILPAGFTADAGDGIDHYYFAKEAINNPNALLDLWAKPLFTLFAMPFAQFGLKGVHFFNILCAVLTALLCVDLAKKLQLRFHWLSFFLLLLTPVYFHLLCSAMTEPFFALVLTFSVWLFTAKNYFYCALLASFLPFARQEGYLFIPVIFVSLVLAKRFAALPFLFTGVLLFSVIGYFANGDFMWLVHDNPYKGAENIYGHGKLLHFVSNSEVIFGFVVQMTLVAGLFVVCVRAIKKIKILKGQIHEDPVFIAHSFIIAGFFCIFFAAHSIMWWRGLNSSLGLLRVIACVAPLAALLSHTGIDFILSFIKNKAAALALAILIVVVCAVVISTRSGFPPRKGEEITLTENAAEWLKINRPPGKIYYSSPWLPYVLGYTRFDTAKVRELGAEQPDTKNDLIVWDSHFGPNENGFPESKFLQDSIYDVIRHFVPGKPVRTLGNRNYEIYVLRKK
jgi:hypothetical protein